MMYCPKHAIFFQGFKCEKCIAKEDPYLRDRSEVADPDEWRRYKKLGWCK